MKSRHALSLSRTYEHYTPEWLVHKACNYLGGIWLDPCSCEEAQKTVMAQNYYTKEEDGLSKEWKGTVFVNPPGTSRGNLVKMFWEKLNFHVDEGDVDRFVWLAFNISHLRVLQGVGPRKWVKRCDLVVFDERIRFTGDNPTRDSALLLYGRPFIEAVGVFADRGALWRGSQ